MAGYANDLAAAYQFKAGGSVEQWRQRMIAETTFTAAEAIEFGLADAIDWTREPVTASVAPRVIRYTPENRSRRGHGPSPFSGRGSGWSLSRFDPAMHARGRLDPLVYGLLPRRQPLLSAYQKLLIRAGVIDALRTPVGRAFRSYVAARGDN